MIETISLNILPYPTIKLEFSNQKSYSRICLSLKDFQLKKLKLFDYFLIKIYFF